MNNKEKLYLVKFAAAPYNGPGGAAAYPGALAGAMQGLPNGQHTTPPPAPTQVIQGTMGGHAAPMPHAAPPPVHNVPNTDKPPSVQWQQISPQQLYKQKQEESWSGPNTGPGTYRGLSRADLQPSNKSPQQLYNPKQTYRGLSRSDLQPSNKIQYSRYSRR